MVTNPSGFVYFALPMRIDVQHLWLEMSAYEADGDGPLRRRPVAAGTELRPGRAIDTARS
jgi:hypothetical protein